MKLKIKKYITRTDKILRDIVNKIRYGSAAPKYAERIIVYPKVCEHCIDGISTRTPGRSASGVVIDTDWPYSSVSIREVPKFKFCIAHWVNGIPWEQTGAYEFMENLIAKSQRAVDHCKNRNDIIARYKKLDEMFETIKKEGKLRKRSEIKSNNFREEGGILIHLGPNGKPIFGLGGIHRFAIASILNLPIPAQIGCVHITAIPSLNNYRKG
ncbi:MAG: hypothetical protein ABFD79_02980 [Phycisphaerales bacterium]